MDESQFMISRENSLLSRERREAFVNGHLKISLYHFCNGFLFRTVMRALSEPDVDKKDRELLHRQWAPVAG